MTASITGMYALNARLMPARKATQVAKVPAESEP